MSARPLGAVLSARDADLYRDAEERHRQALADAAGLRDAAVRDAEALRAASVEQAAREGRREMARLLADTAARARAQLDGLRAAREAIDELVDRHALVVRVHPARAARVRAHLAGWGEAALVAADETLPADGCVIETPAGFIRAGLAEQLDILRHALGAAAAPAAHGAIVHA